jgi:hypothetical protein
VSAVLEAGGMMANKYHARAITVDGERFDSQGEYRRHQELELLQKAGVISNLERQPVYVLQPGFKHGTRYQPIKYKADWRYIEDGKLIVEDFKGFETAVFKLKRKLLLFNYPGIDEFRVTK